MWLADLGSLRRSAGRIGAGLAWPRGNNHVLFHPKVLCDMTTRHIAVSPLSPESAVGAAATNLDPGL
nr:hypothetical protein JVH1_8768 [Rhodococcus sp. JVH1]